MLNTCLKQVLAGLESLPRTQRVGARAPERLLNRLLRYVQKNASPLSTAVGYLSNIGHTGRCPLPVVR